jgi:hypothetical protein
MDELRELKTLLKELAAGYADRYGRDPVWQSMQTTINKLNDTHNIQLP